MASSSSPINLKLDELNFQGIKSNLINYLKAQDQFRDYNFEASGMQVLLDLLAYNTYYNSFYLNMVASETFLATAQKRNSVINIARSLNYTPRSTTSAKISGLALLSVTGSPTAVTIPAYTTFQGTVDGRSYVFNTIEAITVPSVSGVYSKEITLTEGAYVQQRFLVNGSDPDQRFLIRNTGIDTTTLLVRIQNSTLDSTTRLFTPPNNIVDVTPTSQVYYLEEVEDGLFELFFGDGNVGVALDDGNVIIVDFLVSSGALANDIETLVYTDTINGITDITFTEDGPAFGGLNRESTARIKFNAPKSYEAQNRAVTVEDYKALLLNQTNVGAVSVWGGEDNDPPAYGVVYVAIRPFNGEVLTASEKENLITTIIKPKKILTVRTIIVDPEYTYLQVNCTVKYDSTKSILSLTSIEQKVITTIENYNTDDLNEFSQYFRFSKLSRLIDATDRSILNNSMTIKMIKETDVQLGQSKRYEVNFANPIDSTTSGRPISHPFGLGNQITSNEFSYAGYTRCFLEDNNGIIRVYRLSGADKVGVNIDTGTINYDTGKIVLNSFMPTAFADGGVTLKITANPRDLDILPLRNQIINIRDEDIIVDVIDDRSISLVSR
jgi:hypothetical protein